MTEADDDLSKLSRKIRREGKRKVTLRTGEEATVADASVFTKFLRTLQETHPHLVEGLAALATGRETEVAPAVLAELKRERLVRKGKDGQIMLMPGLRSVLLAAYVDAPNQEGKIVRDPIFHPDREHAENLEARERHIQALARRLFDKGPQDQRDEGPAR